MDLDAYLRSVGRNVRRARWAAGLTLEQVAGRGVSYAYLREVESGARNPSLEVMFRLARILDVTVGYLTDLDPKATAHVRSRLARMKAIAPKVGRKPKALLRWRT